MDKLKFRIKLFDNRVGFWGLLTLVFITLKLCGVINWSWWLVLSPIWISLILTLLLYIIVIILIYRSK